jgi:phosphatidylglycerophosphate synthase
MTDAKDEPLAYRSEDRSLLLPYYKRWLVDPLVARLPARLSPNTITHVGHLINLAALLLLLSSRAQHGAPFFVAALLIQLYVVSDNADGAHARRTRQSSPFGEMLDHGLDILNVAYIACISAVALGLDPSWRLLLVALVTAASAITFFEQSATGVFVLGRLNQQESSVLLSSVLCISGALGVSWWRDTLLFGTSLQMWLLAFCAIGLGASAVAALNRVRHRRGCPALWPASAMLLWDACAFALAMSAAISARVALLLVLFGNVFFAGRMLARRICKGAAPTRLAGPMPRIERTLIVTLAAMSVLALFALGVPDGTVPPRLAPHLDSLLALFCCSLFSIALLRDTRRGIQRVR